MLTLASNFYHFLVIFVRCGSSWFLIVAEEGPGVVRRWCHTFHFSNATGGIRPGWHDIKATIAALHYIEHIAPPLAASRQWNLASVSRVP